MDLTGRGGRPVRKVPLPDHPGNIYRPFADLIRVEKIDNRTFRSIAPPFAPGGPVGVGRSYGAHVYMQAAWAACQTVDKGFLLHSVSGNFILAGELHVPFVYKVHTIRNGRSYCTRIVNVTQSEGKGICFTCICSFKTDEQEQIAIQDQVDIFSKYASVLSGKKPQNFQECHSMDVPFYRERRKDTGINDKFPGLECRVVDMAAYNRNKHALDRRQLIFYRTIGDLPDDPNMHLCAHIYVSDRNSLFIVSNIFDVSDHWTTMSSLSHTVTLHHPVRSLLFGSQRSTTGSGLDDADGKGRWFCMESWGSQASSGRALFNARFWNNENTHIMSAIQDGLIRFTKDSRATAEEQQFMDGINQRWQDQSKRQRDEKL